MRVLILALAVMEILISEDSAKGGPSTANHVLSASVDPATFTEEATQGSEDQIGLDSAEPNFLLPSKLDRCSHGGAELDNSSNEPRPASTGAAYKPI